jgi:hypothetical protein
MAGYGVYGDIKEVEQVKVNEFFHTLAFFRQRNDRDN